jgi:hypothetical protein
MPSTPFEHFDEVEILETRATQELEVVGETGVVVGISVDAGERFYAIALESLGRTIMLGAGDLRLTGRRVEREDVYGGESLRVDPKGRVGGDSVELGE